MTWYTAHQDFILKNIYMCLHIETKKKIKFLTKRTREHKRKASKNRKYRGERTWFFFKVQETDENETGEAANEAIYPRSTNWSAKEEKEREE